MTTKENLIGLIEVLIFDACDCFKDGHSLKRFQACAELRIKGLSKLNVKELRQLKDILEIQE